MPIDGSRALDHDWSLANFLRPRSRVNEVRRSPYFGGFDALDIDAERGARTKISKCATAPPPMPPAALHQGKPQLRQPLLGRAERWDEVGDVMNPWAAR